MVLLNAAEQDCRSETQERPGSVCLMEQRRKRPEPFLLFLRRRHRDQLWLSLDPKSSLATGLRPADFGLRQVLAWAHKHRRSRWVSLPPLKLNSAHGECPFHSECPFRSRCPFHCQSQSHSQSPWHSQRHLGECPPCDLRQYLRRELRRSHPRELRRNGPRDLRPCVLRLRVPLHQWLEGCRQAPHLLRRSSLAVS